MPSLKPDLDPDRPLTNKEKQFVRYYVIHLNAKKAAVLAGYRPHSAADIGYRLRHDPKIQAAIDRRMAKRAKRLSLSADRVIQELMAVAFADIRHFVTWDDYGRIKFIESEELFDSRAISEISEDSRRNRKIKLHDKVAALNKLGEHLGIFKNGGKPTDNPLDALVAAIQGVKVNDLSESSEDLPEEDD